VEGGKSNRLSGISKSTREIIHSVDTKTRNKGQYNDKPLSDERLHLVRSPPPQNSLKKPREFKPLTKLTVQSTSNTTKRDKPTWVPTSNSGPSFTLSNNGANKSPGKAPSPSGHQQKKTNSTQSSDVKGSTKIMPLHTKNEGY